MKNKYTKKLANGLNIAYIPYNSVDTVTLCLRGLVGSNYENKSEIGIAHLLEHYVTYGSKNFTDTYKFRNIVLNTGGRITGTTSRDEIAFLVKVLKKDIHAGLTYLSEILLHADLDPSKLDKVKATVKQEILQNIENPQLYISRIALATVFPNTRMCEFNTGSIEHIDNITHQKVLKFYKRYFNPERFILTASGDINFKEFMALTKKLFDTKLVKCTFRKPKINGTNKLEIKIVNKPGIEQLHIRIDYIGLQSSNHNKYAAHIISKIMYIEVLKKINDDKNIHAYTLNIESFSSNSYGIFSIYAAINSGAKNKFCSIVNDCLIKMKKDLYDTKKLKIIMRKIKADFQFSFEKTSYRADYYSELLLFDQIEKDHKKELDNYLTVNNVQIKKVSNLLFNKNPKLTIVGKSINHTLTRRSLTAIYKNN